MKIALITDQHFGVRGDSTQFHNFFDKFYTNFFFPYLDDNKITTIVQLGDIFDRRKYVNFDSLDRSRKYWFDPISWRGIDFHSIIGNHDVYYKNTNRINSPELLLKDYGFHVYSEATNINIGGLDILMLPWINVGNYEDSMSIVNNTKARVVFGHLEFKGFEMYRGAMNDHGLSHTDFKRFELVCSGHFHHKSNKDNIHYLGAPYEMTWSDYDDDRGFHIFDTDTLELTYVKNPYKMFHKLFYDDTTLDESVLKQSFEHIRNTFTKVVVKNKDNPYLFDLYMDRVNSFEPANIQIVEDNFNLNLEDDEEIVDEAQDTITIIKKYIGNLNLTNDMSKQVESLFYDLYQEALNTE
jgi:UDP-2,3-diacylglucosamine pyrophosphatase LpxH